MIRVMVVDDSPLVRKIASDILNSDTEVTVACTAPNAEIALAKLDRYQPDAITMDMEMPGIGGLEAIRRIMQHRPTPIIVLSAHARQGAELTLRALEAGAVDFMLKPSGNLSGGLDAVAAELIEKVKSASTVEVKAPERQEGWDLPPKTVERKPAARIVRSCDDRFDLVAIGTSTGGPVALKTVLSGLPADFPLPIVIVQHMPPVFTKAFAERLNSTCPVAVKEAEPGDVLRPGLAIVAAGNYHLTVSRSHGETRAQLNQDQLVSGHRPSVDVLMHSVAQEYGSRAIGVIMTGMGKDGADGLRELRKKGGHIVAQDKASSVIFGMNREVILNGDANDIVDLTDIPRVLAELSCAKAYAKEPAAL